MLATNGKNTEQEYLSELKSRLSGPGVTIKVDFTNGSPENMFRKLRSPYGDASGYDEVWLVVDEDGTHLEKFLSHCRQASKKHQQWIGVVSRPCFEVWLVAHYEQVRKYMDQSGAKAHFHRLEPYCAESKSLPASFPYDQIDEAMARCQLPGSSPAGHNEMPPTPGTGMPLLVRSLRSGAPRRP